MTKYVVLEAKDKDGLCPIMITEGPFESYVYTYDVVRMSDDGVLSFNYEILEGSDDYDTELFKQTIGDILVSMVMESVDDDRD